MDGVVASWSRTECFSTVESDSPTRVRNLLAISLSTFSTSSFRAACTCCSSNTSPLRQLRARKPRTYWLPRRAIEPSSTAALAVRSQISLASSGVRCASGGWPIKLSDFWMRSSEIRRLFELRGQPLAKRPVKHGVAGLVDEIGEDNRVFVGELGWAMKIEVTCGDERR